MKWEEHWSKRPQLKKLRTSPTLGESSLILDVLPDIIIIIIVIYHYQYVEQGDEV